MVYRGKPSKGCERCRLRRTRCGRQLPSCFQCITASVACSGYRNETDLLFKDESNDVISKFKKQKGRKSGRRGPRIDAAVGMTDIVPYDHNLAGDEGDELVISDHLIVTIQGRPSGLHIPISGTAIKFLLESVLEGSSFSYIAPMHVSTPTFSLLSYAVDAVALAALSNETFQPSLLQLARESYAKAMHLTRTIISSFELSCSDETLASILLLSRFETLCADFDQDKIYGSWSQHVSGSLSILELRGQKRNFATKASRTMYNQVMSNVNLYRFYSPQYRPETVTRLRQSVLETSQLEEVWDMQNYNRDFYTLIEGLTTFFHTMFMTPISEHQRVLDYAERFDEKIAFYLAQMKVVQPYKVVKLSPEDIVLSENKDLVTLNNRYHIYKDHHELRSWNSARLIRMSLHNGLANYIRDKLLYASTNPPSSFNCGHNTSVPLPSRPSLFELHCCSSQIRETLINEICDSAPHFFRAGQPQCTIGAACYLIWPLWVTARNADVRTRDFVVDRLLWMADVFKLRAGRFAATQLEMDEDDELKERRDPPRWKFQYRDDFLVPYFTF